MIGGYRIESRHSPRDPNYIFDRGGDNLLQITNIAIETVTKLLGNVETQKIHESNKETTNLGEEMRKTHPNVITRYYREGVYEFTHLT